MPDPIRSPFRAPGTPSSADSGTRPVIIREARKFARVVRTVELSFQLAGGQPIWATSRDMSLSGVFVTTTSPAPFGVRIAVTLMVPARSGGIQVEGIVRWTSPDGMGVQFGLMGARDTHTLTELLKLPADDLSPTEPVSRPR